MNTAILRHYSKAGPCRQRGSLQSISSPSRKFSPRDAGQGHELRFPSLWQITSESIPARINFIRQFLIMLNSNKKRVGVSIHSLAPKRTLKRLVDLFISSLLTPLQTRATTKQLCRLRSIHWGRVHSAHRWAACHTYKIVRF